MIGGIARAHAKLRGENWYVMLSPKGDENTDKTWALSNEL